MLVALVSVMKTVSTEEMKSLVGAANDTCLVVNVLPAKHFAAGHIRRSINVPVEDDDFVELVRRAAKNDKSKRIVVHCSGESCELSTEAAKKLVGAGFSDVSVYRGGMTAWCEDGQNVAPFGGSEAESIPPE